MARPAGPGASPPPPLPAATPAAPPHRPPEARSPPRDPWARGGAGAGPGSLCGPRAVRGPRRSARWRARRRNVRSEAPGRVPSSLRLCGGRRDSFVGAGMRGRRRRCGLWNVGGVAAAEPRCPRFAASSEGRGAWAGPPGRAAWSWRSSGGAASCGAAGRGLGRPGLRCAPRPSGLWKDPVSPRAELEAAPPVPASEI
ncbi:TMF-regulated nuclear protein 1-like [Eubalaena glacialis]|uniref:TMF-regulated nuclear protein 1-like n=1 Tax=Eubalaena glacialis TaxID=27606 RepID=UPI002A5ADBFB|nr:TMF-regulated nuclear protein 1-like [Eubalaena glacialis]